MRVNKSLIPKSKKDSEYLLKLVYDKFNSDGCGLTFKQTVVLLARLSKHFPDLKKVEYQETIAAFAFLDKDGDGRISFEELREWWRSKDKYEYLIGEKAEIIRMAYDTYKSYTKGHNMSKSEFEEYLNDQGITHTPYAFDSLHKKAEHLTFPEFVEWLEWL